MASPFGRELVFPDSWRAEGQGGWVEAEVHLALPAAI